MFYQVSKTLPKYSNAVHSRLKFSLEIGGELVLMDRIDCRTGRLLIQSNVRNGEPELHYLKLPEHIETHNSVLLLDPQVSATRRPPGSPAIMLHFLRLDADFTRCLVEVLL